VSASGIRSTRRGVVVPVAGDGDLAPRVFCGERVCFVRFRFGAMEVPLGPDQEYVDHSGRRGARPARREECTYREYVSDEQRGCTGCIGGQNGQRIPDRVLRLADACSIVQETVHGHHDDPRVSQKCP